MNINPMAISSLDCVCRHLHGELERARKQGAKNLEQTPMAQDLKVLASFIDDCLNDETSADVPIELATGIKAIVEDVDDCFTVCRNADTYPGQLREIVATRRAPSGLLARLAIALRSNEDFNKRWPTRKVKS